jgi:hypothetical protein
MHWSNIPGAPSGNEIHSACNIYHSAGSSEVLLEIYAIQWNSCIRRFLPAMQYREPEWRHGSGLMKLFGWFNSHEVDLFADAIADDLSRRIPALSEGSLKKLTPDRIQNARQAITARASAFARQHKLNWYKKARLGNTFKWTLLDKGYDKEFVETWTRDVLVAVSSKKQSAD